MSVRDVHPLYSGMQDLWRLGCHSYDGAKAIKNAGETYLPPTSGQVEDGYYVSSRAKGRVSYESYKKRAYYPDLYKEAVKAAVGILHRRPPTIELPPQLEKMVDSATLLGESLAMVLRKINARQFITGRIGVLGDIRTDAGVTKPVIVLYNELAIRNWDDTSAAYADQDVRLVVLDESDYFMTADLSWEYKNRYRVLGLVTPDGELSMDGLGVYGSAVLEENDALSESTFDIPSVMGSALDKIPFAFVNSQDLSAVPDNPPLDGLADLCLAIYRGEADYRQNLFMQGQDTLVRIGAIGADPDDDVRIGAGALLDLPINGDAKYIGVSSNGLPEQRQALASDYNRAMQKSGQLIDSTSRMKESGDALKIRVAAQTATLPQIAQAGAAGLEKVLKALAEWNGADPEAVTVQPNLEFSEADLNGDTLVKMLQAKNLGAKLSDESIHDYMLEQGFTRKTMDDEMAALEMEEPDAMAMGGQSEGDMDNEPNENDG